MLKWFPATYSILLLYVIYYYMPFLIVFHCFKVWPYLLGHYSFSSTEQQTTEYKQTSTQKYNQILEECKCLERILQEKEKDLLALNGFANGETFGNIDMDTESLKTIDMNDSCLINDTLDNISQDISFDSNISEQPVNERLVVDVDNENSNNINMLSVIRSLLDTRENLREMVEKASERGVNAWKRLVHKKRRQDTKKKIDSNKLVSSETFDGLHQKFIPPTESFDLEVDCQNCGKKIIESRQSVIDGKLNDSDIEIIECFPCAQERKLHNYVQEVSPYKMIGSPSSVVYNEVLTDGNDYAVINGIGTPIKKRSSVSSATSGYSVSYFSILTKFCDACDV